MPLSAFTEKSHQPGDAELRHALGDAYASWIELIARVGETIPPIHQVWGFTSAKTGWGLRLVHETRVILYMTPQPGQFLASFVLGEKAVAAARKAKLPAALLRAIEDAPRYAEGRGVRFVVSDRRQVAHLAVLAEIKHRN